MVATEMWTEVGVKGGENLVIYKDKLRRPIVQNCNCMNFTLH